MAKTVAIGAAELAEAAETPAVAPETAKRAEQLEALIVVNPKASGPYVQLAQLYQGAGRKDLAIAAYERFLQIEPGNTYIWQRLQILLGKVDPSRIAAPPAAEAIGVAATATRIRLALLVAVPALVLLAAGFLLFPIVFPSARPIVAGTYNTSTPVWSPDGKRLAFVADRGQGVALWIQDRKTDTSRELPGLDGFGWDSAVAWSADGLEIAYHGGVRDDDEWGQGIYVASARDGAARRVAMGSDPAWSPDGREIAFRCPPGRDEYRRAYETGKYPHGRMCVVNKITGDVTAVIDRETGVPAWQPKGDLIAFAVEDVPERTLDPADHDSGGEGSYGGGGDPASVAEDALSGGASNLLESNQGLQRSMEAHDREEKAQRKHGTESGTYFHAPSNIWVARADGTELRQLTSDGRSSDPVWSFDGKSLLFSHQPDGAAQPAVWRMDPDGGHRQALVAAEIGTYDPREVALSPDGKKVYFRSQVEGVNPAMAAMLTKADPTDLYVIPAGGSEIRRLENKHPFKGRFALSPDGKRIAYEMTTKDSGVVQLWWMSP
jgi:Tol biopolymer transport system component